jgi:hypothetical protein
MGIQALRWRKAETVRACTESKNLAHVYTCRVHPAGSSRERTRAVVLCAHVNQEAILQNPGGDCGGAYASILASILMSVLLLDHLRLGQ